MSEHVPYCKEEDPPYEACPAREKAPHEWIVIDRHSAVLPDGREDLSVILGTYCIHCDKRKEG